MRSDLVFGAHALVPNRYLLCKLTAKATRAFHPPGARIHDTTNDMLERFSHAKSISDLQASQEHRDVPIRRKKTTRRTRHAPIRPTPGRISRGARASIELARMLADPPTCIGIEPVLDSGVLN